MAEETQRLDALISTARLAEQLGCSRERVLYVSRRRGIKAQLKVGNSLLFTPEAAEAIRQNIRQLNMVNQVQSSDAPAVTPRYTANIRTLH